MTKLVYVLDSKSKAKIWRTGSSPVKSTIFINCTIYKCFYIINSIICIFFIYLTVLCSIAVLARFFCRLLEGTLFLSSTASNFNLLKPFKKSKVFT